MTTHAEAAKAIRSELKTAFPGIKFSVRSESYAGGDAVRISYVNGVPESQVDAIVRKYEYGSFDGMTDMYNNDNVREDIPQVKYAQVSREVTKEVKERIKQEVATKFGLVDSSDEQEWFKKFGRWSDMVIWDELNDATV